MGVKTNQLVSRRGFPAGINNTSSETAMQTGSDARNPAELRDAVNVDLNSDGKPQRRPGYSQVRAGDAHSAWSDSYFPNGYYVRDGNLLAVRPDETEVVIKSGMSPDLYVSFDRLNDTVAWTNGNESGLINLDDENRPWACECPSGQPTVSSGSGGSLAPGVYQVAVTFLDDTGRESGTGLAAMVETADSSAILLDNIPQPSEPSVNRVRIYCTNGLDGILRLHATVPVGITSYVIAQKVDGKGLETQLLSRMPPGHLVRTHNGRLLVARGNEVLYSPYLRYGLFNPAQHRVGFTSKITMLQPIADGTDAAGIFVADSKRAYFFPGGTPNDWRQVVAYPYGVVPGTAVVSPADTWGEDSQLPVVIWLATNGKVVMGLPGGQVKVISERAVAEIGERGASFIRDDPGSTRLITALEGAQPTGLQVTDTMSVREYRHNTPC